jgi:hypothetical protein
MAHWRDHLNSSLLGAYSLFNDQTEDFNTIDGVIIRCANEDHLLGASGKKKCLVAYTSLSNSKPMKINATIAKVLTLAAKSPNPDRWVNIPVTFYVDKNVNTKDGKTEAIRVRARVVNVVIVDRPSQIAAINGCKTIEELKTVWAKVGCPDLEQIKNNKKNELSAN